MFGLKYRNQLPTVMQRELDQLVSAIREWLLISHEEDGSVRATAVTASETALPVGAILPYGGTSAPTGYLLCNGAAVSRSEYAALFTAIGTAFGVGNGTTTFNIPDLRGRYPLGKAAAGTGSTLGGTFGALDHTHTLTQLEVAAGVGSTVASGAATGTQNVATAVVNYIIVAA